MTSQHAIALIDFEPHTRGGHFGRWLAWFAYEFSVRFDHVVVFTPDPELTTALFLERHGKKIANISCIKIPKGDVRVSQLLRLKRRYRKTALKNSFKAAATQFPGALLSGFIMWGYDLLGNETHRNPAGVKWAALGEVSKNYRCPGHPGADEERKVMQLCEREKSCVGLLMLDQYAMPKESKKALWIPDVEDVEITSEAFAWAKAIRSFVTGSFSVGFFGMLSGSRGADEVLRLAEIHQDIRFVLAGKLREESIDKDLLAKLKSGALKNVLLIPHFLPTEAHLNAAISSVNALFIDGRNHHVHSSVTLKALHYEKFILTPESNSWVRDVIKEYGTGFAYEDRHAKFREYWMAWSEKGPEASRKAATDLGSPSIFKERFDELVRRLKSSSANRQTA